MAFGNLFREQSISAEQVLSVPHVCTHEEQKEAGGREGRELKWRAALLGQLIREERNRCFEQVA